MRKNEKKDVTPERRRGLQSERQSSFSFSAGTGLSARDPPLPDGVQRGNGAATVRERWYPPCYQSLAEWPLFSFAALSSHLGAGSRRASPGSARMAPIRSTPIPKSPWRSAGVRRLKPVCKLQSASPRRRFDAYCFGGAGLFESSATPSKVMLDEDLNCL